MCLVVLLVPSELEQSQLQGRAMNTTVIHHTSFYLEDN